MASRNWLAPSTCCRCSTPKRCCRWVDRYEDATLAARLGYLFELTGLHDARSPLVRGLLKRRPAHRVYLVGGRRGGKLIARWNLIVPPYLQPASE